MQGAVSISDYKYAQCLHAGGGLQLMYLFIHDLNCFDRGC